MAKSLVSALLWKWNFFILLALPPHGCIWAALWFSDLKSLFMLLLAPLAYLFGILHWPHFSQLPLCGGITDSCQGPARLSDWFMLFLLEPGMPALKSLLGFSRMLGVKGFWEIK